jgi:hypothetical protein
MVQAINALTTPIASAASDTASCYAISATAWVPTIEHPGRAAPYLRSERFRKKVKPTAAAAIAYATKVIAWRAHFADYKRRRREAIEAVEFIDYLEAAE